METFVHAQVLTGSWARKPRLIQSAKLVEVVKEALARIAPAPVELPDWSAKLDEINLRWGLRHMFAHWAIRRVPNEDYIILMTNNWSEVNRLHISNGSIPPLSGVGEMRYALMDAADARGMCEHMVSYEKWIAQKAANWYKLTLKRGKTEILNSATEPLSARAFPFLSVISFSFSVFRVFHIVSSIQKHLSETNPLASSPLQLSTP